ALARLVMAHRLPICLRVLIPAVENSISANSFRPGDVIVARNGVSVEITNTDAEGRLVLADALAEASTENPAVLLDFATLTGAARGALGPDLPALFTNTDTQAEELLKAGQRVGDLMWRLPLYQPYRETYLHSYVADIVNSSGKPHAGAIIGALFLELFVDPKAQWAHMDIYAFNETNLPARPYGGEASGLRACFEYLCKKFA
ncbi:MAG TPA: leucyl aminopeptidase family protein, partial [Coxiellaceae bacterium]|nr:leucyl aminopeptidase family protein [Coxiellaceae bacterium]